MRFILCSLFALAAVGCRTPRTETKILPVDLDAHTPEEAVNRFQEALSVSLTPLETTPQSLFGNWGRLTIFGNDVYLLDQNLMEGRSNILRFDRRGNFAGKISRIGNGPQEYLGATDIVISEELLYVLDTWGRRIQVYDRNGDWMRTIPNLVSGSDLEITPEGNFVILSNFREEHVINIYDEKGNFITSSQPRPEVWENSTLTRGVSSSRRDGNNLYYTLFADYNVYSLSLSGGNGAGASAGGSDTGMGAGAGAGEIDTLYRFDPGRRTLPGSFFEGDLMTNFSALRGEYVMSFAGLILGEEWIVFEPEIWNRELTGPYFFNLGKGETVDARRLHEPYRTLVGHNTAREVAPDGTIHTLVGSLALKEMLEVLAAEDPDYQNSYPFLDGLTPDAIDDEANDWLVSYTL